METKIDNTEVMNEVHAALEKEKDLVYALSILTTSGQILLYDMTRGVSIVETGDSDSPKFAARNDRNDRDDEYELDARAHALAEKIREFALLERIESRDVGINVAMMNFAKYFTRKQYPLFEHDLRAIREVELVRDFVLKCKKTYAKFPNLAICSRNGLKANSALWRERGAQLLTVADYVIVTQMCATERCMNVSAFVRMISQFHVRIVESFYAMIDLSCENRVIIECQDIGMRREGRMLDGTDDRMERFERETDLSGCSEANTSNRVRYYYEQMQMPRPRCAADYLWQETEGKPIYWFDLPKHSVWFLHQNGRARFYNLVTRETRDLVLERCKPLSAGILLGFVTTSAEIYGVRLVSPQLVGARHDWIANAREMRRHGVQTPFRSVVAGWRIINGDKMHEILVDRERENHNEPVLARFEVPLDERIDGGSGTSSINFADIEEIYDRDIQKAVCPILVKTADGCLYKYIRNK